MQKQNQHSITSNHSSGTTSPSARASNHSTGTVLPSAGASNYSAEALRAGQHQPFQVDFNSLTITDDFVFCTTMRDKELCKEFISRILGIKIRDISYINSQEVMDFSRSQRSIRLDVYVEDEANSVYNLEMQTTKEPSLPKRSRYYHSMIDLNMIEKGMVYQSLKNSFVIFICTKDPFHYGQSIYHFQNTCREIPELVYEEGRETIYLNAAGNREGLSPELKNLLDYISGKEVNDTYTDQLDQKVLGVITNKDWRAEYMTFEMKLMDKYQEGLKQGREQGLEQGRLQERSKQLQINRINKYLMSHNMAEDVMKALDDPEYQELLFKKYQDVLAEATD